MFSSKTVIKWVQKQQQKIILQGSKLTVGMTAGLSRMNLERKSFQHTPLKMASFGHTDNSAQFLITPEQKLMTKRSIFFVMQTHCRNDGRPLE
jgi:hypothetical protein